MPTYNRLALGQGHGAVLIAESNKKVEWRCPACGVHYGYWMSGSKSWFFAEDRRRKGRPATGLKGTLTLLKDLEHIVQEDYRVDPIYGVETDILGVWLAEVFHRPGVKLSGSREKVKGKGTPKVKLGVRWWQREDPWEMARESRALGLQPSAEAELSSLAESGPNLTPAL